ncbi:MAG: hypothetical protein NTV39_04170 [Candidatus Saccharibacteria bacterium]|nr:hypothetical protein [Candidatus Saccharibacteria bacterium]
MDNYRTRRFISIAVVVIIIGAAIFGLVYVGNLLFFSGGSSPLNKVETHQSDLLSTSANRAVRMNVRGPIVADEKFHSYQIQITPSNRTLTIYNGYENAVASNESLGNNVPSYTQFVNALDRASFMNSNIFTGSANNTAGVCAFGFLYNFTILQSDKPIKQLWTTTCNAPRGSFGGNLNTTTVLFTSQIPDAQTKISGIWQ